MNLTPTFADVPVTFIIVGASVMMMVVFVYAGIFASRYRKVGPNEVLIISGRRHSFIDPDGIARSTGFRFVKGGGTFVWPVIEKVDVLSLELLTIEVQTPEVRTSKGAMVKVDGVAQVKIRGDDISIATAAEQFLSKSADEIKKAATQTLEGHLRAVLGRMTVEEIHQNRDVLASQVHAAAASDFANMGLGIVSLTIHHVHDNQSNPR